MLLGLSTATELKAQSDGLPRGAYQMPYTRYESEAANRGGGAVLYSNPTFDEDQIAAEASDQQYVGLPGNGAYVQWTVGEAGEGVTLRFTMPDAPGGEGLSGSLDVYVNGSYSQTVNLSSYYAWQYFPGSEPENHPGDRPRMRFDEVHFKLNQSLSAGSTLRIQKTNGDGLEYGVDFVEIEPVPAPISKPAGYVSVTDYGAVANDGQDDLPAFEAAEAAAGAAGTGVYIPAGTWDLGNKWELDQDNIGITGAGIWHTNLYFTQEGIFVGGILARVSGIDIGNFYLNTINDQRFLNGQYVTSKGFMGTYGSNSRIHDVWITHFECGAWIAGYDPPYPIDITQNLEFSNNRVRNNYADGINLCQGTSNSIVANNNFRSNGDDAMAVWPNNAMSAPMAVNNTFRYNTVEHTYRAGGVAIFGGDGHQIHHNLIKDNFAGSGIRLTTDFPGYHFETTTNIRFYENTVIACGTSNDLWGFHRGAIEINATGGPIQGVFFENIDVINSQRHGVQIGGNGSTLEFTNINIDGTGLDPFTNSLYTVAMGGRAIMAYGGSGTATFNNLSMSNIEEDPPTYKANQNFNLILQNTNIALTGIGVSSSTIDMVAGGTAPLSAVFTPGNATNKAVTWTTSNANVATYDAINQEVVAQGTGTATITVTAADGGFQASATVNVSAAVNITATDDAASENGDTGSFTISISETSQNVTVNYTVGGSASGADYSASPSLSGSVTLTPSNLSRTITITATDDGAFEGTENLTLTLQPGSGYQLGGSTTATISIADNESPPCTAPVIGYATSTPTVNQNIEAIWGTAPASTIGNATIGGVPGDFSGQWRALYDANNLYVLVEVSDATRTNDSGGNWWEDDVIEVFIDGDNSKGTSYDGINDFQLGFRWNDATVNAGGNSVQNTSGINFSLYATGSGYTLEAAIPWSTIGVNPVLGNQIGFDVAVDDDDDGGTRDAQVASIATTDAGWTNPSVFGTLYLTDCSGAPGNLSPTANAGTDQVLPAGSTTASLSGSGTDPNNDALTYSWSQVSGPSATISNGSSANASVSGLSDGSSYVFRLTVSDGEYSASDDVSISVNTPAPNQAPTANAGPDQSKAAGTTGATLNGSGSDPEGDALSYAWSQVSGPTVSIANANSASTAISGLADGTTYIFQLTVNDGEYSATDQVSVSVSQSGGGTDGLSRGAYQMPYTRYESESSNYGGGASLLGPTYDMAQLASEATDRMAVALPGNGSYVEWTVTGSGQDGLTLRYSIPDNTTGTLALYVNGSKVQDISLTSYWAWQYFDISPSTQGEPSNTPQGANPEPRMRFDELHFQLATPLQAGDVVKLQKDNSDGHTYTVDFIELESVPAAIGKPAGYISITDYGAIPNDGINDAQAFRTAIDVADGDPSITGIYIPAGRFINGQGTGSPTGNLWVGNNGLTIQGAGMWHTEIYFSATGNDGAGFLFDANNIHLKDFYMNTATNTRTPGNKAVNGSVGTGSTFENIWAEHFETGFWISSMNNGGWNVTDGLLITNCRIRNVYADGVNLAKGTSNTIVEHTSFRNCIDDAMATWSVNYLEAVPSSPSQGNEFRYCTVENNLRAAGLGFFGGHSHSAHHLLIKDNFAGPGIRVNTQFPAYPFGSNQSESIDIYEVTVIGCGTSKNIWTYRFGAVDLELPTPTQGNGYSLQYVNMTNVDILESQHDGIFIHSYQASETPYVLDNVYLTNVNIDGTGLALGVNNGPQYDGSGTETGGHGIYVANYSTANVFDGWVEFAGGSISNTAGDDIAYYQAEPYFEVRLGGTQAVTGVSVSPATAQVQVGSTTQLSATVAPFNAGNQSVTWSSSNSAVASVNANGLVTGNALGSATITVTTAEGSFTATSAITVVAAPNGAPTANAGADQSLPAGTTSASLSGSGTDPEGDALSYSWSQVAGPAATLSNGSSANASVSGLSNGNSYTFRLSVSDGNNTDTDDVTISVAASQDPYGGSAWAIPGTIEAENYDNGGQGVAYNDTDAANSGGQGRTGEGVDVENCSDGGLNVGWNNAGEWLEYTVNVASAGLYDFEFRVASIYDGGTMHVAFGGVNKTGTVASVNTGGWQTWQSVTVEDVSLDAGTQIMRIAFDNPNHNLDKVIITSAGGGGGTVSVTGVSVSPTSATLNVGGTQQLSASVAPSNATNQSLSWSSSNTSVATVSGSGLVTALAAGSATITVTTADGGYTASSSITVNTTGGSSSAYYIRNVWQNTYLQDGGDRVTYAASASGANFQWELEDVGGGYVELKNVGTGEYMHIENLTGYVQSTARTFGWYSSRWAIEDAGNGESRIRNAWQSSDYIHVENLQGHAQHGGIYTSWGSAKWVLEPVSSSREVAPTSAGLSLDAATLEVFPNPVSGSEVTVALSGNWQGEVTLELMDISGITLKQQPLQGQRAVLNLSGLHSGMYLIRITGAHQSKVQPLVVK